MNQRRILAILGTAMVLVVAAGGIWYLTQPHTPAQQLYNAQRIEAGNTALVQQLRNSASSADVAKADALVQKTIAQYEKVGARYPASPEAQDADYRILQIRDEISTDSRQRIALIEQFLKKYPQTQHKSDLDWRVAEINEKELKRHLDAIKLYVKFAENWPKDDRAAEALFRTGRIYEEIREYAEARKAYGEVVKQYPKSKFADEAQFRVASILAERMEKKQEADKEYEKLQKNYPKSRLVTVAGAERKKLAQAAGKSEREKYNDDYYGGVKDVGALDSLAAELETPQMKQIMAQEVRISHLDVTTDLRPADHSVSSTVRVTLFPDRETTGDLVMHLSAPNDVRYIERRGEHAKFSHQGDYIYLDLGTQPLTPRTSETVDMAYGGKCEDVWGMDIITSASTYLNHYNWLPMMQPSHRASAQIQITVPAGYYVTTQGELAARIPGSGLETFVYNQKRPVPLFALAAAPYAVRQTQYSGKSTVPVTVLLFKDTPPEFFDAYLQGMPDVLGFFEKHFGAYPYPKMTVAQINHFPGGLFTPGQVLIGPSGFQKKGAPACFLAHEVAHTWFGGEVCPRLRDESVPWLSEAFAQYWDALYLEQHEGHAQFVNHLRALAANYFSAVSTIKDQPIRGTGARDPMFLSLTYDKGAFVLHALRGLLGDTRFMDMMHEYVREFSGRAVEFEDFARMAEKSAGEPLDWFFSEWLDQPGIPRYRLNSARPVKASLTGFRTEVEIEQIGKAYRMPVDLELETSAGAVRKRLDIRDPMSTVVLESPGRPSRVVLDPDYWILKHPRMTEWECAVKPE